jgi:hypothetical protein
MSFVMTVELHDWSDDSASDDNAEDNNGVLLFNVVCVITIIVLCILA